MNDRGRGWIIFAAVVLGVAGIMRIFDAIWAFRYHGAVPEHLQNALFGTTLKNYGWLWLIIGILLILCAFGVVARSQISRWVGIVAGAVCAISAIWWMPYYPIWSLTYIGIGIIVIYALAAFGGPVEVTNLDPETMRRL
jgi:asparagine N-glycosylation enzyme membrane subunit Stt3